MKADVNIRKVFIEQFGSGRPLLIATAPGRVNLIGEHTDYNEGYVLPMAIEFQVTMAGRPRNDDLVTIYAADYQQKVMFSLAGPIEYDREKPWSNYLRGVCRVLQEQGIKLQGMEVAFAGTIPQGAGLSSSAAVEVATALLALELSGFHLTQLEIARLCQRAENEFVGMNCGIMDQFASIMGKKDHAIFLDCRTFDFEHIPLDLGKYRILVCHSGVKHQLVTSEYNRRRQNCLEGVAVMKQHFPEIRALRDLSPRKLEQYRTEMSNEVYRRCYHIVTENQRVLDSLLALRRGDLTEFGRLMNQSHDSQRDYYEVSCREVDLLVELARQIPGVLGTRLTGGGFGGCTVNLVEAAAVPRFKSEVCRVYQERTGIEPRIFLCQPAAGAQVMVTE